MRYKIIVREGTYIPTLKVLADNDDMYLSTFLTKEEAISDFVENRKRYRSGQISEINMLLRRIEKATKQIRLANDL